MSDWIITNCVFEGDPPEGGWPEWIKASVARRRIEGLRISLQPEPEQSVCEQCYSKSNVSWFCKPPNDKEKL